MTDTYPQVRISPEAHAHLMKVWNQARKARGYRVPMTTLASEAILSLPLPKNSNVRKPVIMTGEISGVAAGGSARKGE